MVLSAHAFFETWYDFFQKVTLGFCSRIISWEFLTNFLERTEFLKRHEPLVSALVPPLCKSLDQVSP